MTFCGDEYDIQIELGDIANILPISPSDRMQDIERLVMARLRISSVSIPKIRAKMLNTEYINPTVLASPQAAFLFGEKIFPDPGIGRKRSAENLLCVIRRGIPIPPGDDYAGDHYDYIVYAKEKGCFPLQGTEDPEVEYLNVLSDERQVWK